MRPVPVVFLRFALMLQLTKRKCYNDFRAIKDCKLAPYLPPCEQSPFFSTDVLDRALQESRQIFVEHARGLRVACALSLREDHFILACTRGME